MDINNVNPSQIVEPGAKADESLLAGAEREITTPQQASNDNTSQTTINTTFKPALGEEATAAVQKDVEYKPAQDVVQEKTEIIANKEQERMQKMQQKELLININKTKIDNLGSTYSRNLDEAAAMGAQKKDMGQKNIEIDKNRHIQSGDKLVDKIDIGSASEELYEEFMNPQNKKKEENSKSNLKDFEEDKRKKENDDEENEEKSNTLFSFEDDEVIDIDINILASSNQLDKKDGTEPNLSKEIERRIGIIDSVTGHPPNKNKLKKLINQLEEKPVSPALERALRKDVDTQNISKLRQKFNKR